MHFIKRSPCPTYLKENQQKWTQAWVAYYAWKANISNGSKQPKKPKDAHWRDDRIRLILIKDFHNNCGYCGESLPTPTPSNKHNEGKRTFSSKGDVDHLLPKAMKPELVYEWTNYIWSCKPCNQHKNEFFNSTHPLFNPCCEDDCFHIEFIEDTGQYALKNTVCHDEYWQQRFKQSEGNTLLNADELCKKRQLRISTLRQRFKSIDSHLEDIKRLQFIAPDVAQNLRNNIQGQFEEIKQIIAGPDFFHLLQHKHSLLCDEYPNVMLLLS